MFYTKNVPVWERALRLVGAAGLAALGLLSLEGMLSWVAVGAAVGMGISALFGYCPACAMVGRRLD